MSTTTPTTFLPNDVDALLQHLAETDRTWADGAALFGPGGLFDPQRKTLLSVRACAIRDDWDTAEGKLTESYLDQLSHADEQYTTWLDTMETQRAKWLLLDAQRDAIQIKLKSLVYIPR